MAKLSFPEWYRKNRPLLGLLANLWFLPGKYKRLIKAFLDAFDSYVKPIDQSAHIRSFEAGDYATLHQIMVDEN